MRALVILLVLGLAMVHAPAFAAPTPCGEPGCASWMEVTAGSAHRVLVSPDGTTAYFGGAGSSPQSTAALKIEARSARTGELAYSILDSRPYPGAIVFRDLALSPGGATLFAAGTWRESVFSTEGDDVVVFAHAAADGATLWSTRLDGADGADAPGAIAVAPDGSRVFVAARSVHGSDAQALVAALDAATGATLWRATFGNESSENVVAAAVTPDGAGLLVLLQRNVPGSCSGCYWPYTLLLSFSTADGALSWVAEVDGSASGLAIDGTSAYTAGGALRAPHGWQAAVRAFRLADGALQWDAFVGSANTFADLAAAISVGGGRVVATGYASGAREVLTFARDAATGAPLWSATWSPSTEGTAASAMVLSPDGSTAHVGGYTIRNYRDYDWLVAAYDAADGTRLWTSTGSSPGEAYDVVRSLALVPDGSRLLHAVQSSFLTGAVLAAPIAPPSSPQGLATAAAGRAITLTWSPPASDGGAPVLGYVVYGGPRPDALGKLGETAGTSWTESGLPAGAVRHYAVAAFSQGGEGERSATVAGHLLSAPTQVTAKPGGVREIVVSWQPPLHDGDSPVTGYLITRQGPFDRMTSFEVGGDAREFVDGDAVPGLDYWYSVTAVNSHGAGPASPRACSTGGPVGYPSLMGGASPCR